MSKRYGVVFGNNYKSGPLSANSLNGCWNDADFYSKNMQPSHHADAELWAKKLGDFDGVQVLKEATKAAMVAAITSTLDKAVLGDLVVICYSGHGTIIPPGTQSWVPLDFDWDKPATWLTYDELDQILMKHEQKGVLVVIMSDSCHSRANPVLHMRGLNPHKMKNRFLEPPDHIKARIVSDPFDRNVMTSDQDDLLLSGCQKNQTSADAEINGVYHGAFSYGWNEAMKKNAHSYQDSILGARSYLASEEYDQVPDCDGLATVKALQVWVAPGKMPV